MGWDGRDGETRCSRCSQLLPAAAMKLCTGPAQDMVELSGKAVHAQSLRLRLRLHQNISWVRDGERHHPFIHPFMHSFIHSSTCTSLVLSRLRRGRACVRGAVARNRSLALARTSHCLSSSTIPTRKCKREKEFYASRQQSSTPSRCSHTFLASLRPRA